MAIPTYPVILTQADWNKKKGLFAKMAGETGLGALMLQTETLYKAVDWNKFDVRKVLAGLTSAEEVISITVGDVS